MRNLPFDTSEADLPLFHAENYWPETGQLTRQSQC